MLRDAELFVMSDQVLVEVLGRIRPEDRAIPVPAPYDTPALAEPVPMWRLVEQYAADSAAVPAVLAKDPVDTIPADTIPADTILADTIPADSADLLGSDPQAALTRLAVAADAAAAEAADGERVLPTRYGELPTWDYLRRCTIARALLAHYVAAYLGSTACPLTEELGRLLWELTEPDAARWRDLGMFADPMPLPDHVSWRDRFLLCAGHLPHPVGH